MPSFDPSPLMLSAQIGDFGMARDLTDETYYEVKNGSKIPVKWTAPEVSFIPQHS